MLKGTYDISTKLLTIFGNQIITFIETIDDMGEWRTVYDFDGNALYDIQLDFDDSIDKGKKPHLNVENYNLQYVNLIVNKDNETEMGDDWQNAELTVIKSKGGLNIIGVTCEITFNPNNATFRVLSNEGKSLYDSKSFNRASDYKELHCPKGSYVIAIDENGTEKLVTPRLINK